MKLKAVFCGKSIRNDKMLCHPEASAQAFHSRNCENNVRLISTPQISPCGLAGGSFQ